MTKMKNIRISLYHYSNGPDMKRIWKYYTKLANRQVRQQYRMALAKDKDIDDINVIIKEWVA